MADAKTIEDTPEIRERWGNFQWTPENAAKAMEAEYKRIFARWK